MSKMAGSAVFAAFSNWHTPRSSFLESQNPRPINIATPISWEYSEITAPHQLSSKHSRGVNCTSKLPSGRPRHIANIAGTQLVCPRHPTQTRPTTLHTSNVPQVHQPMARATTPGHRCKETLEETHQESVVENRQTPTKTP